MSVKLRWKTLQSGKKSAYLDIYHNGERHYEFLKIYIGKGIPDSKEKKSIANAVANKRALELTSNDYDYLPSFKKEVDFIKYFESYTNNYSKRDVRKLISSLTKFKDYFQNKKLSFKNVTPKVCEGFKDYLTSPESGLSGETPYGYWKQFKGVFRQAMKDNIIIKNPTEGIVFKGTQKNINQIRKNVLTKDELQLLAKTYCGNSEVKRAFLFACFTGLGMAEIRKLTWSRIMNNKIKIYREKNGQQILNDLPNVAIKLIGEKGNLDHNVFSSLPSDNAINKNIKNWVKKAGINKHITFYCGRHTFATQLLLNGANLKTVADCMGHTTTEHTLKYLNYVDSLKTDAISNLPDLEL